MTEVLITSSALILALTAARFLFRNRISRRLQYALWGLVLLRLLLPFPLPQSDFSVLNGTEALSRRMEAAEHRELPAGLATTQPAAVTAPAAAASGNTAPVPTAAPAIPNAGAEPAGPSYAVSDVLRAVWLTGAAAMLLWFLAVNLTLSRRLRRDRIRHAAESCPLPVYVTDRVVSPCLFGLFRPAVYITPSALASEERLRHVLTHELCHYRHGDHIWSVLRSLCLCIYWFHPLAWLAAFLSKTDGELACDEAAIHRLGSENRLSYGRTLVDMIAVRRQPSGLLSAATTMTSGKRGIQQRLRRIVKNPKTLLPAVVAAVLLAAVFVGCTFTGASGDVELPPDAAAGAADGAGEVPDPVEPPAGEVPSSASSMGEPSFEVTLIRNGEETPVVCGDPELPNDLLFYSLASSAWVEPQNLDLLDWAIHIRQTWSLSDTVYDYYAFRLDDGTPVLQSADDGFGSPAREELMARMEAAAGLTPGGIRDLDAAISQAVLEEHAAGHVDVNQFAAEAHQTLGRVYEDDTVTVYIQGLYLVYSLQDKKLVQDGVGGSFPMALTFRVDETGDHHLTELWNPRDGAYYGPSIREKFPPELAERAMDNQNGILARMQSCQAQAIAYFGGALDLEAEIARAVDCITADTEANGGALDYHVLDDRAMLYNGDHTLNYILGEFLKGGQTGTRGDVLWHYLNAVYPGEAEPLESPYVSAQQSFDEWKDYVVRMVERNGLHWYRGNRTVNLLLGQLGLSYSDENPRIAVDPATLAPSGLASGATTGVGVRLDYADEDFIVFHGYFGLFAYDLKREALVLAVDLMKAVGTNAIQGGSGAAVSVTEDGRTIQLTYYDLGSDADPESAYYIDTASWSCSYGAYEPLPSHTDINQFYEGEYPLKGDTLGDLTYTAGGRTWNLFSFD